MKLTLVAMPWQSFDSPSPALGLLSAYIRKFEPRIEVQTLSEYVKVWSCMQDEYCLLASTFIAGELLYLSNLYPERKETIACHFQTLFQELRERYTLEGRRVTAKLFGADDFQTLHSITATHLEELAQRVALDTDVLGLTTTVGQLFASLCLARRVKEINPKVVVVFGGAEATIAGKSLLLFDFVDFVILGEGEHRFLHLVKEILDSNDKFSLLPGILGRSSEVDPMKQNGISDSHQSVVDLEQLPYPEYDEYSELAEKYDILWWLPFEGSRGCWWDRRAKTHQVTDCCYFCGVTAQRSRYDKSVSRISEELSHLTKKHRMTRFYFIDMLLRQNNIRSLSQSLKQQRRNYRYFVEIRANIATGDLLELFESGCHAVQIGIEGLSTSYLGRINKGTTTIRNLHVMRLCYELGITTTSNLLIDFPGATGAEVEETRTNIAKYAIVYEPLDISKFALDRDSPAFNLPERFGITNIRNNRLFRDVLPEQFSSDLQLPWLEYDLREQPVDWRPVIDACRDWRNLHANLSSLGVFKGIEKPLFYFDGSDFLEIIDRRTGIRTITLDPLWRDIYLYCMEIRSTRQIVEKFGGNSSSEKLIAEILGAFVSEVLMYQENNHYLSLAVAWRPDIAVQRIREQLELNSNQMDRTELC